MRNRWSCLVVAVVLGWAVACDSGSGDGTTGGGDVSSVDTAPVLPDAAADVAAPDTGEACTAVCDPLTCQVCEKDRCVSACEGAELCHAGVCEVPPTCECAACESCDTSDPWAPTCVDACPTGQQCEGGVCVDVLLPCEPACESAACEECVDGACVSHCVDGEVCTAGECGPAGCDPTCDPAACEQCDLTATPLACVSTCDAEACEACDGAGGCAVTCDADACETCNGAGECVGRCDADACEACDGAGGCASRCDTAACEACDGAGGCATTCGADEWCDGGTCAARPDLTCEAADGFCAASVVSALAIAPAKDDASGEPPCCCDYSGDGVPDNALSALLALIGPGMGYDRAYFNGFIDNALAAGAFLVMFEYLGLDDLVADEYLDMNLYMGQDANASVDDNFTGGGTFLVAPDSLDESGAPRVSFQGAAVEGGHLLAGPAKFVVPLMLLGSGENPQLAIDGATIDAVITRGALGYDLDDGKVCGYVLEATIVDGVNEYVRNTCACLDLPGDFLTASGPGYVCDDVPASANCDPDDEVEAVCDQLAQYCGLFSMMLPQLLDVDTDDDGRADAMSVGLTMSAVSADILGVGL